MLLLIVAGLSFLSATLAGVVFLQRGEEFLGRYRATFTESATANMSDMFMFIDAQRLFYINMIAIVVLPLFTWMLTGDALSSGVVMLVLVIIPGFIYRRMRKRRLKLFEKQLPDGLAVISGAMRAGASLNIAMENLVKEAPAPMSQEFELFLREQRVGADFDTSLKHMEKRLPLPDFLMLTAALRISREVGGNLAEILENLANTLRRKATMEGKIDSLTAQGKLQGIVMTGLPILLAVLLMQLEPEAMGKLFSTHIGWAVCAVIVVMESMGYMMISKITSIDV
ncbi:MAG TPA: type II secretion system F family protein [Gammaproteobacteria bacterium]|nr:type II secretion system F family protein [Gammaproteobacteria bacterium]